MKPRWPLHSDYEARSDDYPSGCGCSLILFSLIVTLIFGAYLLGAHMGWPHWLSWPSWW